MERIDIDFDDIEGAEVSPAGSSRTGYVSYEEKEQYLVDHIREYLTKKKYLRGWPVLTVHSCWSGYSSYTITSQWEEIGIEWDGHTAYFKSAPEFFKALSEVADA